MYIIEINLNKIKETFLFASVLTIILTFSNYFRVRKVYVTTADSAVLDIESMEFANFKINVESKVSFFYQESLSRISFDTQLQI